MNNKSNRINIFWIEDNPIQENTKEKNGVKFPSFEVSFGDSSLLSFKLFQHPNEVKEYLAMINKINRSSLTKHLCEISVEAIPDIVVFDYKLSDNFSTTNPTGSLQYSNPDQYEFIKNHSAAVELKKSFDNLFNDMVLFLERPDVIAGNYSSDEFKNEVELKSVTGINDEFGLYAGIAIVREFKEYVTFGVPATLHARQKSNLTENSLFFEWLNTYDLKDAIEKKDRGSKNWDEILKFCLPLLLTRLESQIATGKAIPSYSQLTLIAEGNIPNERILSFETIYGKRHLPLDGLFMDITENRDAIIATRAGELLNKLPISNSIINKSLVTATTLWNTYLNDFEDRIVLSDYSSRIAGLNKTEQEYLKEIQKHLGVDSKTGLISESAQCSIQTLLDKEKDINVVRLTFLITVATASIALEKQRVESNFDEKYALLNPDEYFNILYPKVNLGNTVLLPMHFETGKEKDKAMGSNKKWLSRYLSKESSIVEQSDIYQFDRWILKGEKEILKAIFFDDSKYFPHWFN